MRSPQFSVTGQCHIIDLFLHAGEVLLWEMTGLKGPAGPTFKEQLHQAHFETCFRSFFYAAFSLSSLLLLLHFLQDYFSFLPSFQPELILHVLLSVPTLSFVSNNYSLPHVFITGYISSFMRFETTSTKTLDSKLNDFCSTTFRQKFCNFHSYQSIVSSLNLQWFISIQEKPADDIQ